MENHPCSDCNFTSKWRSSTLRHFMRKHIDVEPECPQKVTQLPQKVTQTSTKGNPTSTKGNPTSTKGNPIIFHKNQCEKCEKIFTKHCTKVKHQEKCKGKINPLECIYCQEVFTMKNAKYRHQKKCKIKKEQEHIQATTINNITNNNITNIGTQNNITVNIVKYDNLATIEFDDKHISDKDLKRIFRNATTETLQVMIKYANKLLQNPKNLCVRKKHLTNSYCEVHKGDGKWEVQPDRQVFDKITQDISISANDRLYENDEIGTNKIRNDILELTNIPLEKEITSLHNSLRCNLRSEVINKSIDCDEEDKEII